MRTLVAVDLDQTLIYSTQSIGRAGGTTEGFVCVELLNGAPQSFVTQKALAGLVKLNRTTTFVPATTRTREQYERINMGGIRPAFAVVANGAELLVDGLPDSAWAVRTAELLAADALGPNAVAEHLHSVLDPAWTKRIAVAQGVFAMAVVERDQVPAIVIEQLRTWAAGHNFVVSVQGRRFYVIPEWLSKQAAVEEVRRRTGATRMLSAGDSLLDTCLLSMADAAVRPAHGELEQTRWTSAGVSITITAGVFAGEEIVAWLLAESDRSPPPVGMTAEAFRGAT